jgi:WXG100 family type VII secretion target
VSDSNTISASPEHLAAAAKQVGFHTDEVSAAHNTSLEQLEASYGGWVGQSASALDAVGTSWRSATQHHVRRLDGLNDHLRTTGTGFEQTDRRNGDRIAEVGRDGAEAESSSGSGVELASYPGAGPGNEVEEPVLTVPPAEPGPNAGPRVPDSIVGTPKPLI